MHPGVGTGAERDDLQRHVRVAGHLDQMQKLRTHHLGATDLPMQRGLVHNGP